MNQSPSSRLGLVLAMTLGASSLQAANILWDGTGTSWNNASSWSLFSNATTPNPAAKPGAGDTAIFNIETVNTAQTVNLNAPQAALGLVFNTTGGGNIETGTGVNALTIGAGGISVSPGALPLSIQTAVNLSAPQTWNNDGGLTLNINGAVNHGGNHLTIAGQGGSPLNGNTTINGALGAGNLTLTKNGGGTLRLNGANQFSGDLVINAGSVVLGNFVGISTSPNVDVQFGPSSTGVLSLNGNIAILSGLMTDAVVGSPVVQNGSSTDFSVLEIDASADMTYAGVLRDGGSQPLSLAKRGAGALTLTGNLPYTGSTVIFAGAIRLAGPDNPLGGGGLQVTGSGAFELNGRSVVLERVYLAGNGFSGGLSQNAPGNATLTVPPNAIDDYAFSLVGVSEGRVEVAHSDGSLTLDARLFGSGAFYKFGAGTLVLARSSVSSFFGRAVVEEGTLAIGHDLALGSAALSLLGGAVRADGGARSVANSVLVGALGGIFTGSDDLTLSGVVSGPGHLTKTGAGKLTLAGANTQSGGATVEEGALEVNGALPADVEVRDGAILQGMGTVDGAVRVDSGGELTPGGDAASGTLTVDSLTLGSGATARFEIAGTTQGSGYDHLEVAGNLALAGSLNVLLSPGFTPSLGQLFDLVDWGTRVGIFGDVSLPALAGGLEWDTSLLYSAGVLSVVSAGLTGDYNNDGLVDAADYSVWRDGGPLQNETASIGVVDAADYTAWRTNYGATAPSQAAAVPEPAGALLLVALAGLASRGRQAAGLCR